ncbi:MAG: hypothetical protein ABR569_11765 [Gaiellaceae bacterium]
MGFLDKILGRSKQAAGDMLGDTSMRREGVHQEKAGKADERAQVHEEAAVDARVEEAEHRSQE